MADEQQSAQSGQDGGDWITGTVFQVNSADSSLGSVDVPADCFPDDDSSSVS